MLPVFLLGASLAAAQAPACRDAYRAEYAELWELSRPAWEAACAGGAETAQALRYLQRAFQADCAKVFSAEIQKGRASESTVLAFCAQGVPGRRRLRSDLGLPAEASPGAEPAAEGTRAPKPGESGMGPMASAVAAAKDRWAGACLLAMEYAWTAGQAHVRFNRETKQDEYRPEAYESYQYVFHAPAKESSTLLVSYGDVTNHGKILERLQGPELEELRKSVEGEDCLVTVAVDLQEALAVAGKSGWAPDGSRVTAYLLSRQVWAKNRGVCHGRQPESPDEVPCPKLSKAEQRRLGGRELWVLVSGGKTAFLDAAKGERLLSWRVEYGPYSVKSLVVRDRL
ncbi:MAG: hypothetical protein HY554_05635 [Elusimicrobia bacterium]|nr:hypothetical protein [Elusimicrobiota bacterium]